MIQFNDIYDTILESKAKDKRISNIQYMEGYFKIINSNEDISFSNAFIITLTEDYHNKQFLLYKKDDSLTYNIIAREKVVILRNRWGLSESNFNPFRIDTYNSSPGIRNFIANLNCIVLSSEKSSELFKYTLTKKEMVNGIFRISNFIPNYVCKHNNETHDVVEVYNPNLNKNLKFVSSDLKLSIPDFASYIKGINIPSLKLFKIGSTVMFNNKTRFRIKTDKTYVINDLRKVSDQLYCSIKIDGYNYTINQNNLKLIE